VTRVLVVGAGSIGARHVRNLSAEGVEVCVTDTDVDRAALLHADGVVALESHAAWAGTYDGVVIATPTAQHAEHARAALGVAPKVLLEKPIGLSVADAAWLAEDAVAVRIAVAYNLRFHAPVERLVELVADGAVGTMTSARFWFGSWLPDWRPQIDYRDSYSAQRALGGGVLLDAIHELDLALWLVGPCAVVGAVVGRFGPLEIDVEDTVVALLTGPRDVPILISLDYLSRTYRRGIEVVGDEGTVRLDWSRRTIEIDRPSGATEEQHPTDAAASYVRQTAHFVQWLADGPAMPVDGRLGLASLALAEAIAVAARR